MITATGQLRLGIGGWNDMSRYWALLSIVFMIPFVFLYDKLHRRNCNYRRLWEMYRELQERNRQQ
jgi:hypothetical protein